jgi:hypothetical protein
LRSAVANYADIDAGRFWLNPRLNEAAGRCVISYDTSSANITDLVILAGVGGAKPSYTTLGHINSFAALPGGLDATKSAVVFSATSGTTGRTQGVETVAKPASVTPTGQVAIAGSGYSLPGLRGTESCYTFFGSIIASSSSSLGSDLAALVDPAPTLARCLRVVESRRHLLGQQQIAALERQLRVLLSDERELSDAGLSVSVASLNGLIDFLAGNVNIAHPNLSVTHDGYFAASWSPRQRARVTITFRGADAGEWAAVDLDATPPESGKGNLAQIPSKFKRWMFAA